MRSLRDHALHLQSAPTAQDVLLLFFILILLLFLVAWPTLVEAERLEEEGHRGLLSQPTAHQTKPAKYVEL